MSRQRWSWPIQQQEQEATELQKVEMKVRVLWPAWNSVWNWFVSMAAVLKFLFVFVLSFSPFSSSLFFLLFSIPPTPHPPAPPANDENKIESGKKTKRWKYSLTFFLKLKIVKQPRWWVYTIWTLFSPKNITHKNLLATKWLDPTRLIRWRRAMTVILGTNNTQRCRAIGDSVSWNVLRSLYRSPFVLFFHGDFSPFFRL